MTFIMVSICQADYWLPQGFADDNNAVLFLSFNLPSRLLASPRSRSPRSALRCSKFQSAKQITGFPKMANSIPTACRSASFNLPSRLLASPRTRSEAEQY